MNESFAEAAHRAFAFLLQMGFRLDSFGRHDVRYESDQTFVVICWDDRSGELDARVGLLPQTDAAPDDYSLADIITFDGVPEADTSPPQIADPTRLGPWLERMAAALRTHGQRALSGDTGYFERLESHRSAKGRAYLQEMQMNQVRAAMDKAWHDQDFERFVSLCEPVESELTSTEARKLIYARRHGRSRLKKGPDPC